MKNQSKQLVAQNIKRLTKLANNIDSSQPKIASQIDKVTEDYFGLMKEAQYVGIQGYALRNSRCFDNCLRQKRAKSDKPYEEIWNDCHQEYLTALDSDGSETWNKYANAEDKNIKNLPAELIKTADALLELSDQVEDQDNSKELIAMANELIKESQWFSKMVNKFSPSLMNIRKSLEDLKRNISSAAQSLQSSKSNDVGSQIKRNLYNLIGQSIQDFSSNTAYQGLNPRAKQSIQAITNGLGSIQGQIGGAKQVDQLMESLENSEQIITQLINNTLGEMQDDASEQNMEVAENASDFLTNTVNSLSPQLIKNILNEFGYSIKSANTKDKNVQKVSQVDNSQSLMQLRNFLSNADPSEVQRAFSNVGINVERSSTGTTEAPSEEQGPYELNENVEDNTSETNTNNSLEMAASAIQSLMSQLQNLPKDQESLQAVTEAVRANGWQNPNEAQHIAQWLMGFRGASSLKFNNKNQRKRII